METDDSREEVEIITTANEILAMHPSRKTLIYGLHALLDQFEAHLDTIIKRYKVMTMTLLLATGAAIGFSFSSELKDLPINKLIMTGAISILGVIGISAIWYLDIQVFHKFWGAFFIEELKMEKEHPFLINIGDSSESLDTIKSQLFGEGNFYIFLNVILITVSGASLSFLSKSIYVKIIIFMVILIIASFIIYGMIKSSRKLHQALKELLR